MTTTIEERYRTLVPARMDQQSGAVLLDARGVVCMVQCRRIAGDAALMELAGSTLIVRPDSSAYELPMTVRWKYMVSLLN